MFDLSGRVAAVTGGNGGIGLGIAEGLARAGARVVIGARNPAKNAAALAALRAHGAEAEAVPTDLRDPAACRGLIEAAVARFGRLDILVNNAGISFRKAPQDYTLEDWQAVMETNLTAAFTCCQAAFPHFRAAGGGKVINVGSLMSTLGSPYAVAYGASKGGLMQMTRSLTCSWARDNIQANIILPGWIDTELSQESRRQFPDLEARVLGRTPAGRWGTPGDFAGVAVFLASPLSDFVNGVAITVDGGYSILG